MISYAEGDQRFPEAEEQLVKHLKERYIYKEWQPVYDAVFAAENDSVVAVTAVTEMMNSHLQGKATSSGPSKIDPKRPEELERTEKLLLEAVENLQGRRRIWGTAPTLEELLNPIEEEEIGERTYNFPNGDEDIIQRVLEEKEAANQQDDGDTSSSDDEDDELAADKDDISATEAISLCQKMDRLVLTYAHADGVHATEVQRQMRRLLWHLRKEETQSKHQITLDAYFGL